MASFQRRKVSVEKLHNFEMKLRTCEQCSHELPPEGSVMFARNDYKVFRFCGFKCSKLFEKNNPRGNRNRKRSFPRSPSIKLTRVLPVKKSKKIEKPGVVKPVKEEVKPIEKAGVVKPVKESKKIEKAGVVKPVKEEVKPIEKAGVVKPVKLIKQIEKAGVVKPNIHHKFRRGFLRFAFYTLVSHHRGRRASGANHAH